MWGNFCRTLAPRPRLLPLSRSRALYHCHYGFHSLRLFSHTSWGFGSSYCTFIFNRHTLLQHRTALVKGHTSTCSTLFALTQGPRTQSWYLVPQSVSALSQYQCTRLSAFCSLFYLYLSLAPGSIRKHLPHSRPSIQRERYLCHPLLYRHSKSFPAPLALASARIGTSAII